MSNKSLWFKSCSVTCLFSLFCLTVCQTDLPGFENDLRISAKSLSFSPATNFCINGSRPSRAPRNLPVSSPSFSNQALKEISQGYEALRTATSSNPACEHERQASSWKCLAGAVVFQWFFCDFLLLLKKSKDLCSSQFEDVNDLKTVKSKGRSLDVSSEALGRTAKVLNRSCLGTSTCILWGKALCPSLPFLSLYQESPLKPKLCFGGIFLFSPIVTAIPKSLGGQTLFFVCTFII